MDRRRNRGWFFVAPAFLACLGLLLACEPGGLASDEVQVIDGSVLLGQSLRDEVREDDFSTFPAPLVPGAAPTSEINPILIDEDGASRQVQTFYTVDRSTEEVIEFYRAALESISFAEDNMILGGLPNGDEVFVIVNAEDELNTRSEVNITVYQTPLGSPTHELGEGDFGTEVDRLTGP